MRNVIRKLAIIVNLILLGMTIYALSIYDYDFDLQDFILVLMCVLTPILNILTFIVGVSKKNSFVKLWFERKVLEEQKKIEELKSKSE